MKCCCNKFLVVAKDDKIKSSRLHTGDAGAGQGGAGLKARDVDQSFASRPSQISGLDSNASMTSKAAAKATRGGLRGIKRAQQSRISELEHETGAAYF